MIAKKKAKLNRKKKPLEKMAKSRQRRRVVRKIPNLKRLILLMLGLIKVHDGNFKALGKRFKCHHVKRKQPMINYE